MFKKILRRIINSKYIINNIDYALLSLKLEQYAITEYKKKVKLGDNSQLHTGAIIENLQRDSSKICIGSNTHIRGELLIYPYGNGIKIGNNSYVGANSVIRAGEEIVIGNDVLIAHNVTIIDSDSHEIDFRERAIGYKTIISKGHPIVKGNIKTAAIIIHDNVWISYNVCILKGVTIGKGAIIAAGSVVTKNVAAFTLVAGNPAKFIKNLPQ